MDKVYIVETTHENGEKERREVEATHIIEAFQKGTYDCYATMVIVKEKVSRDYKAEIAYLTAENERLRGEVEEQKSIAEHEHASQMEWFSIAGDYKAENAELRARLERAIELPYVKRDCELTQIIYKNSYGNMEEETYFHDCYYGERHDVRGDVYAEARLKELQEKGK